MGKADKMRNEELGMKSRGCWKNISHFIVPNGKGKEFEEFARPCKRKGVSIPDGKGKTMHNS